MFQIISVLFKRTIILFATVFCMYCKCFLLYFLPSYNQIKRLIFWTNWGNLPRCLLSKFVSIFPRLHSDFLNSFVHLQWRDLPCYTPFEWRHYILIFFLCIFVLNLQTNPRQVTLSTPRNHEHKSLIHRISSQAIFFQEMRCKFFVNWIK